LPSNALIPVLATFSAVRSLSLSLSLSLCVCVYRYLLSQHSPSSGLSLSRARARALSPSLSLSMCVCVCRYLFSQHSPPSDLPCVKKKRALSLSLLRVHARVCAYWRVCVHSHRVLMHVCSLARTHTHTHVYTRTHTHTHTHTHTNACVGAQGFFYLTDPYLKGQDEIWIHSSMPRFSQIMQEVRLKKRERRNMDSLCHALFFANHARDAPISHYACYYS